MVWPIGFSLGNNSSTTVWPTTAVLARLRISWSENIAPRETPQLRMWGYSGDSPMTCVFQLRPFASTCARSRTSGLTATTSFNPAIASASPTVSVGALPQPPRIAPLVKLPEKTVITLEPMLLTWSSTCLVAPEVKLTEPMTAPTPMMMPSIVSSERILFRSRARPAILSEARILMTRV